MTWNSPQSLDAAYMNLVSTLDFWPHNQDLLRKAICNFNPFFTCFLFLFLFKPFPSLILSPFSSSSGSSVLFPCAPVHRNLTATSSALLPSPRLHTSKWFAKPQATHSQWTGLLLTTAETYNMPGNRGNHSGGDGPMAIDTHPPTRLESVMCDLHPWFLSKRLHTFRCLSFIKQTLHLQFYGMKNAGS